MIGGMTHPVTSPIWGPPPPRKQALNVYTDQDNRERARARDKNKGGEFPWKNVIKIL